MLSGWSILLGVLAPLVMAGVGLALPRRWLGVRVGLSVLAPVISIGVLLSFVSAHGLQVGSVGFEWMPRLQLDVLFRLDQLGLFFALLVAGIGLLIAVYARAYFGRDPDSLYRFYPSLLLFMTAMLGVVVSDNFMLLLLFWELTSISSFLLIGWEWHDRQAVKNAMQAFIVTNLGGLALMAGLILLGSSTGVWTFTALLEGMSSGQLAAGPLTTTAFVLMFVGAAAKSAQWPLHFWLPGAMAAPTPVSAYLHSATMVKAGVYLMGRLAPVMAVALEAWPVVIVPIGGLTMVLGAYVALRRSDLKQIFAYTTVSQLGLLMSMYGLSYWSYEGERNLIWDITQILNHALYKAPLFILAGAGAHVVHTRELPQLRGLFHRGGAQKIMAVGLILAGYALAAGPLTLSFVAKEFFFYQVWHAYEADHNPLLWLLIGAAVLTGAFNTAIFVRLTRVLVGRADPEGRLEAEPPAAHHPAEYVAHQQTPVDERPSAEDIDFDPHDRGWFWPTMLWAPAMVLVVLQYVGGVVPGAHEWLFGSLERSVTCFPELPMAWDALAHPGMPLYMSLVGFALGIAIGFSRLWCSLVRDWHDALYPAFYNVVVYGGARLFRIFQTGHLRTYIAINLTLLVALFAWCVHRAGLGLAYFTLPDNLGLGDVRLVPGYLVLGVACLAALLMPRVRQRVTRVLVLGVVGTSVTAMYYLYAAPDLALTQISIEVVSLLLFLLVLTLLPDGASTARSRRPARVLVGVAVGGVVFWLTLMAGTASQPQRIVTDIVGQPIANLGDYFLRNSKYGVDTLAVDPSDVFGGVVDRGAAHAESFGTHPPMPGLKATDGTGDAAAQQRAYLHKGGGGANVVNVILVDFRGFDTMGEITVLGLAALGVWTLLRRHKPDDNNLSHASDGVAATEAATARPLDARLSTLILQQGARFLVPLSLVFSMYVFFKGHQTPGGGFVGGLIASVALIVYRMTRGGEALSQMLRIRERKLIAIGLSLALLTGLGALVQGLPFLTSNNGYLPLGGGEAFHWATVMFFDAGVFLVVVGVTVGMIDALSRELEIRT